MSAYKSLKAKVVKPASTTSSSGGSTVKTTSAAKTIADYKADYAAARARGDAVGMKAANDGANAIRAAQGLAAENASGDIASVAAKSVGGVYSVLNGPGTVSKTTASGTKVQGYQGPDDTLYYKPYVNYTGTENSDADRGLMSQASYDKVQQYKKQYADAQARGDSAGMTAAHQAAEAIRAQYGYSGGTNGGAYNVAVLGQSVSPTNLQKVGWTGGESSYGGSSYGGSAYGSGAANGGASYGGSASLSYGGYDSLEAFKKAMGYDTAGEAMQQAIDAYIQKTVNGLESQRSTVNQGAEDAAKQAYLSYLQSKQNLPQQLSAGGYSGGMADSQRIGLDANLQNSQSSIERQRLEAAKQIDDAIINARLEGSIQSAEKQSALDQQALAAYQDYRSNLEAMARDDYWKQYNYDWQSQQNALNQELENYWNQYNYDWQEKQNQADRDWQSQQNAITQADTEKQRSSATAWTLLEAGVMPEEQMLNAAGISRNTAAAYLALKMGGQLAGSGSTTGGSGTSGGGYDNGGLTSDQIRQLQSYYGVTADGLWGKNSSEAAGGMSAADAWNAYQSNQSGSGNGNGNGGDGGIQLGATARSIYSRIAQLDNLRDMDRVIVEISTARGNGSITKNEAEYLSGLLGY